MKQIQLGGHRYKNKPIRGYALVDDEQYDELNKHLWCLNMGYPTTNVIINGITKTIRMHRMVMGYPDSHVDHIDGNTLDNRHCNLRLATHRQNSSNSKIRANNVSGYKGVSWRKDTNKWTVRIRTTTKYESLGSFTDIHEAATAYNDAAIKHYGSFARLNVLR